MTDKDKLFREISDAFKPILKKGSRYNADTMTNGVKEEMCRFFSKNISEKIAYLYKRTDNNSYLVISEKGIYHKQKINLVVVELESESRDHFFAWEGIDRIEYSKKKHDFYIYFDKDYQRFYSIGRNDLIAYVEGSFIGKFVPESTLVDFLLAYTDENYCVKIAESLTRYAKSYKGTEDSYDEILALEQSKQYNEAFELADKLIKQYINDEKALVFIKYLRGRECINKYRFAKSKNVETKQQNNAAINDLEWSLQRYKENGWDSIRTALHFYLAFSYKDIGNVQKARRHAIASVCDENFLEESSGILQEIEVDNAYYDNYLDDYEYVNRKYIMPLKSIEGCYCDTIEVFIPQKMPKGIMFSDGIAKESQIYIGHPYNKSVYVPLQDMEDTFFVDKVHELCYLLQCLGAEEISITSVVGKSLSELNNSTINISGNTDIKAFSGQFDTSSGSDIKKETTSNNERNIKYTLDPMRSPFVPEGLVWYPVVPEWQRLVKSRMNTNVLEYSETVSTSQVRFTSDSEKEELKASARYLWAKANTSIDINVDKQFKETIETQWKVEVKFRSLKDFDTESVSDKLCAEEKEYLDELKECLAENAQISPAERRLLDKFRDRLGISKDRAEELEHRVMRPVLTDEEKEYIEIFKELSGEGEFTERKRRMLDRERDALGITVERASELEQIDRPVS